MIGTTISHYRITEKLGEGGMGVVYKAEDTKLRRPVALKFLAAHLVNDEEVKARFTREAEAAAALNHPNICTVHEIDEAEGKTFIAMVFIEGEPLDKKIEGGPLKLQTAVDIAIQTAKGLQAAHGRDKPIVHRDIKPANLMVGPDGHVTIMDFGLAQLADRTKLTSHNETPGTVVYMSPEQTYGMDLDHRTDIWSLGVTIYEMVTGRQPFKGHYQQAVTFSITNEEPEPITALRAGVPMELEWIVGKALAKDREQRYQHTDEMIVDLQSLSEKLKSGKSTIIPSGAATDTGIAQPGQPAAGPQAPRDTGRKVSHQSLTERAGRPGTSRERTLGVLVAVLGLSSLTLAVVALTLWFSRTTPEPKEVLRFSLNSRSRLLSAAISPDGRRIAYSTTGEEGGLWIQDLSQMAPREMGGLDMALALSWSPDSRSLALWAGKALVRVSIPDGAIQTLSPLDERPNGTSWSPDGSLISFASNTGVYEVLSRGGTPRLVYKPEDRMMLPRYLPLEGTARALLITSFPETADVTTVALLDMETGGKQDLIAGANAAYDRSGHILYQDTLRSSEATVWGVPFSLESLEIQEEPFLITDGHSPSVSNQGSLVYRDSDGEVRSRIAIRGRDGELIRSVGDAEDSLLHIRLSPNGKSIAIRSRAAGNSDIWVYDVDRGSPLRLTFHPGNDSGPIWSPDGAQIAYGSFRGSWRDIYRVRPNEAGGESPLYESPANKRPTDWSRDGRYILFRSNDELRYLARSDDGGYEDLPLMSASGRLSVRFSPD